MIAYLVFFMAGVITGAVLLAGFSDALNAYTDYDRTHDRDLSELE